MCLACVSSPSLASMGLVGSSSITMSADTITTNLSGRVDSYTPNPDFVFSPSNYPNPFVLQSPLQPPLQYPTYQPNNYPPFAPMVDSVGTRKENEMPDEFKIGDEFITKKGSKITLSYKDGGFWRSKECPQGCNTWTESYLKECKLINQPNMLQPLADLSNLIQRTFNEDTKTLYRAGYLSKDLNITDKLTSALGEMFVGHIIDGTIKATTLETFATELVTRAKEEIAEAEEKKK